MLYIKCKDRKYSFKSIIICLLFFAMILSDIFFQRSYLDEIIACISALYIFFIMLHSRVQKEDAIIMLLLLTIIIIGIISNINSMLINNKFAIIVDIIAETKVLLAFFAMKYFVNEEVKIDIVKLLYKIAKLFIILAFIFAILTIFVNTGMYTSKRYGLPSFKFFFPMEFQFFIVELLALAILIEYYNYKKINMDKKLMYMSLITIALITKGPPLIFVMVFLILLKYFKNNTKIKLKVLIPIIILGCVLGSFQIKTYLLNENAPRSLFFKYSFITANDYFPFGSGFATFASDMAARNYSKLYLKYGFNGLFGMNTKDGSFLSDTFWPMAIAQFGWIFGIIYIGIFLYLFKFVNSKKYNYITRAFLYAIILQFYVHALGSAILSSSAGVLGFMIIGILIMPNRRNVDNEKRL